MFMFMDGYDDQPIDYDNYANATKADINKLESMIKDLRLKVESMQSTPHAEEDCIDTSQVQKILNCSQHRVYQLVRDGYLTKLNEAGNNAYSRQEVERYRYKFKRNT